MLIGIDASRAFETERTGTENYSYYILKEILSLPSEHTFRLYLRPRASVRSGNESMKRWLEVVREQLPQKKNFELCVVRSAKLWTQMGLAWELRRRPVDVLFVPAHTLPIFRPKRIKTVVTIHDLGYEYLPEFHTFPHKLWLTYFTEYACHHASRIIAVSEATKADLINKFGVGHTKVQVVHEGFDKTASSIGNEVDRNAILSKYGLVGRKYFIFVGTIQPRKNLKRLIEAFGLVAKKFRDMDLILAGKKGWLSEELYEMPKEMGLEKRVRFLGYVDDLDQKVLYEQSVAMTFPSLFEGFGLPIIEAQALGVPVLTSAHAPMNEVGGDACEYVNAEDANDIAKGMMRLLKDEERRNYLRERGLENVKRFSWQSAARETMTVLED